MKRCARYLKQRVIWKKVSKINIIYICETDLDLFIEVKTLRQDSLIYLT